MTNADNSFQVCWLGNFKDHKEDGDYIQDLKSKTKCN